MAGLVVSPPPETNIVIVRLANPAALAAALPVILNAGYRVTRIQPVDMFPHTDHIETVVTLSRG